MQQGKPEAPKTDRSNEAFVIEQFSRKEKFENDGTSSREDIARIRIQSEAGVQRYGVLSFSYASGTGTLDVGYVRVRKPDGSVVETPADSIQDMAAQITREAPFYSDLHEKHIPVKGLSVGDVLEYQIREKTTKPLAERQFWTSYEFTDDQIVLDEQLEISVPHDRSVKIKSATIQPTVSEAGGYRIYSWHSSNLLHKDESKKKREATEQLWQVARGRLPRPDVLLSSFATWDEVGRWYGALQQERVKPTPEVIGKAAELTKNAVNDDAKLHTLYNYVSTQFHYIGVSFGIGRYQPHSAEAVLENQYGDCKDKHTLLASLLTSSGIPAHPALISSSHEVDEDVPSPGQFDHVITVVPRDAGLAWLDSTTEVGPYQYLVAPLRDKHALVIWNDKPAALLKTPADPPYETVQTFNMEAKLNDSGELDGSADFSARGDVEYVLRASFRAVPLPQWKDLGQRVSFGLGFGGEVSEVTVTSPEKTDQAFHLMYKYTRKNFGDWPNHRIVTPQPLISLTAPTDEELLPLGPTWLGVSTEIHFRAELELPGGYRPVVPAAIHLKKDFAEYDAAYEFRGGKFISDRHLKTLMREVPASEREQYKEFAKTIQDDYGAFIPLEVPGTGSSMASNPAASALSTMSALRNLPDSASSDALRLESGARGSVAKRDLQTAVSSLYRAVEADPKFARAWVMLGALLFAQKQTDAGIDAFHKAIAAEPEQPVIRKALGFGLMAADQTKDAVSEWQEYMKAHPDDVDGPANLGNCFLKLKQYPEAAVAFETAVKLQADRPNLQMSLASAYLLAGERDKAVSAFSKLAEIDSEGIYLNDAAYQMADADLDLAVAVNFAKKAVRKAEEESEKVTLASLKTEDLKLIFKLAAYWDTLGWANERISQLQTAEQYLRASWNLTQDGVVAGHLCHLYRRTHQTATGIQMCKLAIYRIPLSQQLPLSQYQTEINAAQENLSHLTGGSTKSTDTVDASNIVIRERTFKLPRFLPGTESAEFFLLFASDGTNKTFKVQDVKFISGSDKMKSQGRQLKALNFNIVVPDDAPTRFVRRGILGCYQYSGCSFVLLDPSAAQGLN